jgi:hypothetical protein
MRRNETENTGDQRDDQERNDQLIMFKTLLS